MYSLPQGCPLHVVIPTDQTVATVRVDRGTRALDIAPTIETQTYELDVDTMMDRGCRIDTVPVHTSLAKLTLTLPGTRAGDVIELLGGRVEITAPAACPA